MKKVAPSHVTLLYFYSIYVPFYNEFVPELASKNMQNKFEQDSIETLETLSRPHGKIGDVKYEKLR